MQETEERIDGCKEKMTSISWDFVSKTGWMGWI